MKKLLVFCGFLFLTILAFAQEQKPVSLDSVVVSTNRVSSRTPATYTEVAKGQIEKSAPNYSIPQLLNLQPSVVATTEAGSGLGYSKISVRGSDATRINVSLNGVTINDAESQEVFWVNIPSLTSFLQSVQLQRGIGTTSNGVGSFGASIDMQTNYVSPKPYSEGELSYGSFNTVVASMGAGSGLTPSGFSFDARYSYNITDGYIRNGKGKLNSFFATMGYLAKRSSFKVIYIYGDQHTGITWEGASREMLESDRRGNIAGMYYDEGGNVRYYDNETDNYTQHFVQGFFSHRFDNGLYWNNTLNFTKGAGYYENYKDDAKFSKYGLQPQNSISKSDLIIRQQMDNEYYVVTSALKYRSDLLDLSAGGTYSYYDGLHFGNVIWAMHNENIPDNYQWYDNTGDKWEAGGFVKGEIDLSEWTLYADVQYRHIDLKMAGMDKDFASLDYQRRYNFVNPKIGARYTPNEMNTIYLSAALGHKEPSRSDIKESIKSLSGNSIRPEAMLDVELGYKFNAENFAFSANLYMMEYKDQLVSTGKLSDVGYEIKENVPNSYRRGVELSAAWSPFKKFSIEGNITLSDNKIKNYTSWTDLYDEDWNLIGQVSQNWNKTHLMMSPSVVGMAMATYNPWKTLKISVDGKYVGKQYYDNTSSQERSLPGYFLMGGNVSYDFKFVSLSLFLNNILNKEYISNAWVYRAVFENGDDYVEEGFFPQPGFNWMLKATIRF